MEAEQLEAGHLGGVLDLGAVVLELVNGARGDGDVAGEADGGMSIGELLLATGDGFGQALTPGGLDEAHAAAQLAADRLQSLAEQMEARKAELGAPVLADKIDRTKEELTQLAQDQEIPGRSTMSKEELAATVAPS